MAELAQVLRHVFPISDEKALVDGSTGDDAAVYLLDDHRALVVTTDFFTPIVDDPYAFGQIAAANALSDLYAMGAKPLFALNLLAFPRKHLEEGSLEQIIKGGAEKCREAGIPILGGHSIDDAEPKYGLVAIGEVDPAQMCTNDAAHPGQSLVLTKPIGTGIIATAIKAGQADPSAIEAATASMAALNRDAGEAMLAVGLRAATDVTGFGLLGLLPGALDLARTGRIPGGTQRNLEDVKADVSFAEQLPEANRLLLADAQTSGGLLMAVSPDLLPELLSRLEGQAPDAAVIGKTEEGPPGRIQVD
jgi:selenide,water dikinase